MADPISQTTPDEGRGAPFGGPIETESCNTSTPHQTPRGITWLLLFAGFGASLSAGTARIAYPDLFLLPPIMGMIAGFLFSAPLWGVFQNGR